MYVGLRVNPAYPLYSHAGEGALRSTNTSAPTTASRGVSALSVQIECESLACDGRHNTQQHHRRNVMRTISS